MLVLYVNASVVIQSENGLAEPFNASWVVDTFVQDTLNKKNFLINLFQSYQHWFNMLMFGEKGCKTLLHNHCYGIISTVVYFPNNCCSCNLMWALVCQIKAWLTSCSACAPNPTIYILTLTLVWKKHFLWLKSESIKYLGNTSWIQSWVEDIAL